MVRFFRGFWEAQAIERDRRWWRKGVVVLSEPICAGDHQPACLRIHSLSEIEQFSKWLAGLEGGDIAQGIQYSESSAGIVNDLVSEETREIGIVASARGWVR